MLRWTRNLTLLLLTGLLAACQNSPVVRLYDGPERPTSEVTVVRVPETIEIMNINGQRPAGVNTLFSSGYKDLHLRPGTYQIVAFYKEIWDTDSTTSHVVLRSEPVIFDVDGRPGSTYHLEYEAPANVEAARAFADNFSGWSRNTASGERAPTRPSGTTRPGLLTGLADAPEPVSSVAPAGATPAASPAPVPAPAAAQAAGADADYLARLKVYWSQASDEERRAFLRWVYE